MNTPIAAVSFGKDKDRLAIFGLGSDEHLYWKYWAGNFWLPSPAAWSPLKGEQLFADLPAVVSRGDNRLDIVARGKDNKMYSRRYDGHVWSVWEDLGGGSDFTSPPVAAWHNYQLVVFTIKNIKIYYTTLSGTHWSKQWTNSTGSSDRPVALVSRGKQLYVFSRGHGTGFFWRAEWQAQKPEMLWNNNEPMMQQQKFDGPPAVLSGLDGCIDIFGLDSDKKIRHWRLDKSTSWEDLDGKFDTPAAVSSGQNRLDIFALRDDKKICRRRLSDNGSWSGWVLLSEAMKFDSLPAAVSRGEGRLDVFAQGADGQSYWYDDRRNPPADWIPLGAIQSSVARLRDARGDMIKRLGLGTVS